MKHKILLYLATALIAPALAIHASPAVRAVNGSDNNPNGWGAADQPFTRLLFPAYADGIQAPSGPRWPNPREVSNAVCAQHGDTLNNRNLSDVTWQWGQFIDHDITLTEAQAPAELFDIPITDPADPLYVDGDPALHMRRSRYDPSTSSSSPRQQMNSITAFLDASAVYGSDETRALALRTLTGGRLLTSGDDNLLPLNTAGLPNANDGPFDDAFLRLAGDVRANEQPGLIAMHTLFMREHNRLADAIAAASPGLSDEEIYQQARRIVGALIQVITYQEYLPALLGPYAPRLQNQSYDPTINPTIANEFATAFYRFGHTMISADIYRVQNDGTPAPGNHIPLRFGFFYPGIIGNSSELNYVLKGLASHHAQELDTYMVDDLREFLFGPPGAGGLDLAALNIQRGRDHGLPDYNTGRQMLGLQPAASFADITRSVTLQTKLASLYVNPDALDLWVGDLAEAHLTGTSVGPLLAKALALQFRNLMIGDRFFFLWDPAFSPEDREAIQQTTLADVIKRNTGISNLQKNVFFMPDPGPDTDLDGIPDWWELSFNLDPTDPADGLLDSDEDGVINVDEFLSGTNPRDNNSVLTIRVEYFGDNMARISFDAMPNTAYSVMYRDNMMNAPWLELAQIPVSSTYRAVEIVDPITNGSPSRFYRVVTLP